MNWADVVSDYSQNHPSHDEVDWFRQQASLENAIHTAAFAINHEGKRYSHQYKIRREAMEEAYTELMKAIDEIRECETFDDLLNIVEKVAKPINGIGGLYCYDTAFRIGAYQNLFPQKVYLHCGTRNGARYLGWDYEARTLETSTLPAELQHLQPHEVEDILCIYRDCFKDWQQKRKRSGVDTN